MIINTDGEEIDILIENCIKPLISEIGTLKLYINDEKEYIKKIEKQTKVAEEGIKKEEHTGEYGTILTSMLNELLGLNKNFIKERKRIIKKYIKIIEKNNKSRKGEQQ